MTDKSENKGGSKVSLDPVRFIVLYIDKRRGATVYVMALDFIGRGHLKSTVNIFICEVPLVNVALGYKLLSSSCLFDYRWSLRVL